MVIIVGVSFFTRELREREREGGGGMLNVAEYLVTVWRYVFRGMRSPFIMIYHKYVSATCRFTVVRFSYLEIIVQGVPFILALSAEAITRCYGCCKAFCFAEWQDKRDTVVPLLPRTLVVVTWLHLPGIFVRRWTQNHLGLPQFVNPSATHLCLLLEKLVTLLTCIWEVIGSSLSLGMQYNDLSGVVFPR